MSLRADSKYTNRRAYVLNFRSDATNDEQCGRLENLVTSERSISVRPTSSPN